MLKKKLTKNSTDNHKLINFHFFRKKLITVKFSIVGKTDKKKPMFLGNRVEHPKLIGFFLSVFPTVENLTVISFFLKK